MSNRDIWSGGRYYDLDEALAHAQDSFEAEIKEIWEEASGAERIAISHERAALDIRDKGRRNWTATEFAIASRLAHADWLATQQQEPGPDEVGF